MADSCIHNIALTSYCNACIQDAKVRVNHGSQNESIDESMEVEMNRTLKHYTGLLTEALADKATRSTGILAEMAAKQATAKVAAKQVLAYIPSWTPPEVPAPAVWRSCALESLLLQAEANRRILYLESVMADIADVIDPIKYPFLMAKINTILYPPIM